MIKIAVVENDKSEAERIVRYAENFTKENGESVVCNVFKDGVFFMQSYRADYDIIFIRVELSIMDGIKTAKSVRKTDSDCAIVLLANTAERAIEGYEVDASDYIVKPLTCEKFERIVRGGDSRKLPRSAVNIVLSSKSGVTIIPYRTVSYIEVREHELTINTEQGIYTARKTIKQMEELLSDVGFMRCNQCYLVNLRCVTEINENFLTLSTGVRLPMSRSRKKKFTERFVSYASGE